MTIPAKNNRRWWNFGKNLQKSERFTGILKIFFENQSYQLVCEHIPIFWKSVAKYDHFIDLEKLVNADKWSTYAPDFVSMQPRTGPDKLRCSRAASAVTFQPPMCSFSGLSEKFWSQLFLRCIFSLRLRKFVCIRARRVLEFGEALRSN